jgi:hypothetical protein
VKIAFMWLTEDNGLRFTVKSIAYAALGFMSLILSAMSVVTAFYPKGPYLSLALFLSSAGAGVIALILNVRWLRRIAEGAAGEYDLAFTWAGFFSASFSCLFYAVVLLVVAA